MINPSEETISSFSPLVPIPQLEADIARQILDYIPNHIWDDCRTIATRYGFQITQDHMLSEQQRLQQEVYKNRNTLWDNVQKLQSQGYQVKEVKMRFLFESPIAKTQIACEIITDPEGTHYNITRSKLSYSCTTESNTIEVLPEYIAAVIDGARNNENTLNLPSPLARALPILLERYPDIKSNRFDKIGMETQTLTLFKLSTESGIVHAPRSSLTANPQHADNDRTSIQKDQQLASVLVNQGVFLVPKSLPLFGRSVVSPNLGNRPARF